MSERYVILQWTASYMSHAQFNNTYSAILIKIFLQWLGDKTRLSQVLINLLGNVKIHQEWIDNLTLIGNLTDCQTSIRFEVKDTGISIALSDRSKFSESQNYKSQTIRTKVLV
jgi:signal transduction histidine kinase